MPDVDLLIRTSNEFRISNFLLWQIAYAELHFTPVLWPDFGRQELFNALRVYQAATAASAPSPPLANWRSTGRPSGRRGRTTWGGWGRCTSGWLGARLAGVVGFAKARLDGEVVVADAGGELAGWPRGRCSPAPAGSGAWPWSRRTAGSGWAAPSPRRSSPTWRTGVATVLLHATALGRPVYERLGRSPRPPTSP